jgi:hypothetical protein
VIYTAILRGPQDGAFSLARVFCPQYRLILLLIFCFPFFLDKSLHHFHQCVVLFKAGQTSQGLHDIRAQEVVRLLVFALSKTLFQMLQDFISGLPACGCHLPDTLNALPGGDEFFILGVGQ